MPDTETTCAPGTIYIQGGGCAWCNGDHTGLCPLVLEIEYRDDGGIRRIVFVPPDERARLGANVTVNPRTATECNKDLPVTTWGDGR